MRITAEDAAKGKMSMTIATVESVVREAKGDMEIGTSYRASGVHGRALRIQQALADDIRKLAADIEHGWKNQATIDECDNGHKFAKMGDHPMKNGRARCPHCMASGLDELRAVLADRSAPREATT